MSDNSNPKVGSIALTVNNTHMIYLPNIGTPDGCFLTFAESNHHIPFDIKRVYYIHNFTVPGLSRGGHAHKAFEQVMFCVKGSFVFRLDDGKARQDVEMTDPAVGVYFGPGVWHEMVNVEKGTVILVLASHPYAEDDYIRDYSEFIALFSHKSS